MRHHVYGDSRQNASRWQTNRCNAHIEFRAENYSGCAITAVVFNWMLSVFYLDFDLSLLSWAACAYVHAKRSHDVWHALYARNPTYNSLAYLHAYMHALYTPLMRPCLDDDLICFYFFLRLSASLTATSSLRPFYCCCGCCCCSLHRYFITVYSYRLCFCCCRILIAVVVA